MIMMEISSLDSLDKLIREAPYVLVNCTGEGCYGCELLEPVYKELAFDMPGLVFSTLDPARVPDSMDKLAIDAMPTLLYFRRGKEVHRTIGSMDRQGLLLALATLLYGKEG